MTWIMLLSKCSTCTYRRREREERESEGYLNYASEHSVREEGGRREGREKEICHLVMAYWLLILNKVTFPYVNICMHSQQIL